MAFVAFCLRLLGALGGARAVQGGQRIDPQCLRDVVSASGWPTDAVWTAVVLLVTLDAVVFTMGFLAWTTA